MALSDLQGHFTETILSVKDTDIAKCSKSGRNLL